MPKKNKSITKIIEETVNDIGKAFEAKQDSENIKDSKSFQDSEMTSVMIATPSYRGDVHAYYTHCLVQTVLAGLQHNILFHPFWVMNDALVQRCRNDLFKIAYNERGFSSMLCIDADMIWNPQWAIDLVKREEDLVGGTCRKKTDDQEMYVTGMDDFNVYDNGLMKAISLGMGFVKISRKVIDSIWESSEPYKNPGGSDSSMVFDIGLVNGELWGEDSIFWKKCREHGFQPWVDPNMTCCHIGQKVYSGDFNEYLKKTIKSI